MTNRRPIGNLPAGLAVLAAVLGVRAAAQPILLRGTSAELQETVSVSTYAGAVPATIAPVEVSGQILLLVLSDAIAPDRKDRVRAEIQSFLQSGELKNTRLGALHGEEFVEEDPFRTRAQAVVALRRVLAAQASEPAPYAAAKFYRWLANAAGQFGSNWSSVVLIGPAPDLDAPLREYAAAYVASHFEAQKVRLSYWNPDGADAGWFGEVCRATGGASLANGLQDLGGPAADSQVWREIAWKPPTEVRGFLLYRARLTSSAGAAPAAGGSVEVPAVAVRAGAELPDLDAYTALRQNVETARRLASETKPTDEQAGQIRAELEHALSTNPSEPDALRLAADFYTRFNDYATVAQLLAILAETSPKDGVLLAELGHAHFQAQQMPQAEAVLLRAREAGEGSARVTEELARIHLSRGDDAGAMPFLDESLKKDAKQPSLWFLRADAAGRLKNWKTQSGSLERGLELDGQLERRTALVRIYLDHKEGDQALRHIRLVTAALPKDPKVGQTYAEFLDELGRSDDALALWQQVRELDGSLEVAHFRVTRLLVDKGALPDALRAADARLGGRSEIRPALRDQGRDSGKARHGLCGPACSAQGRRIARRSRAAAALERTRRHLRPGCRAMLSASGRGTGETIAAIAGLSARAGTLPGDRAARQRCGERAKVRGASGGRSGGGHPLVWPALRHDDVSRGAWIPGGLEALAFIAHSKPKTPPERFFVEYAKAVRLHKQGNDKVATVYFEAIRQHFELLSALEALGQRDGDRVRISLSLRDKKAQQQTEKVINLLGWKLQRK